MHKFKLLCILTPLSYAYVASAFASGISTKIPVSTFDDPSVFWGAAATEFYGPYNKKLKCWIGNVQGDEGPARLCMRPHKLVSIDTANSQQHFLAFAGFKLNEQGGHDNCHACSGTMGLVVLEAGDETFSLVAKDGLNTAIGSWGEAPHEDEFELRQISENGDYGWVIHTGYTGQGYTYLNASIHGIIGDRIVDLGYVPDGFSDLGNCDDNGKNYSSGEPCTEYEADMIFTGPSVGGFKTIHLKHRGTFEGKEYNDVVVVPFDINEGAYKVPAGALKIE
jgi:hypothetical protein